MEVIKNYPLSFKEFMNAYGQNNAIGLEEYLTYGGMPEISSLKDIVKKYTHNNKKIEKLLEVLSQEVGNYISPSKLSQILLDKDVKISDKTISTYLKTLEDEGLILLARKYDIKKGKYFNTPFKYYFLDTGMQNAIINFRHPDINKNIENVIFLELKRKGFNVSLGMIEKYKVTSNGKKYEQLDINFIASNEKEKYYIQFIDNESKHEEKIKALLSINDNSKKIVIVKNNCSHLEKENNLIFIKIYDFLLNNPIINN